MSATSMRTVTGRDIAAMLNPRLAVLVTCCDQNGRPNVLTIAWHTPLSHQPSLVGISIAPSRYSHALIRDGGEFVINIVGKSLLEAVKICGTCTGEIDDKLEVAGLKIHMAKRVRPPILDEALGVLECQVIDRVETGDHTFFIGQVLLARVRDDCFDNAWKSQDDKAALQCLQRDRYGIFMETNSNGHV